MVLLKMKETADLYLGTTYFNNLQHQATKDAGTISGYVSLMDLLPLLLPMVSTRRSAVSTTYQFSTSEEPSMCPSSPSRTVSSRSRPPLEEVISLGLFFSAAFFSCLHAQFGLYIKIMNSIVIWFCIV